MRAPASIDLSLHPAASPRASPEIVLGTPGATRAESGRSSGPALRPSGGGSFAATDSHFKAKIAYDGEIEVEGRTPPPTVGVSEKGLPLLALPVDINDLILSVLGEDPYAYEQQKLISSTAPLRAKMADAACKERLQLSVFEIKSRLEAIWHDTTHSIGDRRRAIFQLWDQCAEDGPPDVQRTSEQIRASILAYVNAHMPKTSIYAYSNADLQALNQSRRSVQVFAPYGKSPDAGVIELR